MSLSRSHRRQVCGRYVEGGVVVHGASALKRRVKKQLKNGVSDKPVRVRREAGLFVRRRVEPGGDLLPEPQFGDSTLDTELGKEFYVCSDYQQ